MGIDISTSHNGVDPADLAGMFEDFGDALDDELEDAATDIGVRIESAAKKNIRADGAIDQGQLINSIEFQTEMIGEKVIRVMVGSNVDHAAVVEKGADPFFPPPDALEDWTRRVLGDGDLAFVVARSISETGIDPRPYLRPAFEENAEWAQDRIRTAILNARDDAFS